MNGFGTVFRIDADGSLTTVHAFNDVDGSNPSARLAQGTDGALYGTTIMGGPSGVGTIFRLDFAGALTTLHAFVSTDGANPESSLLLASDGNFYGTTTNGGAGNSGTVFRITPSGVLTTLHAFSGGDGVLPIGGLLQAADGSIYGTTYMGGSGSAGTIYRIDAGLLATVYAFNGADEGAFPVAGLLQASDGRFYGTTTESGAGGGGTIYRLDASGTLTSVWSFSGSDGSYPEASLIEMADGRLYGTTYAGGVNNLGTIFRVDSTGTVTTLHAFNGGDGANPYARLVQASDGRLYGATVYGGPGGAGVVFRLTTGPVVTLVPSAASGVFAGVTNLSATLMANNQPSIGKTIVFTLSSATVGSAVTDASGVATLTGVSLAGMAAGTYPGAVQAAFAGDGGLPAVSGVSTLQVSQAVPALAWPTPSPIAAGVPLSSAQLNATSNVAGTFAYTPGAGTVPGPGTHPLTAVFSPADALDYTPASITVMLTTINHPPVLVNPGSQTNSDGSPYAYGVLVNAPAAYWRLGEAAGTNVADSAGSNAAARIGGVTLGQPGALADGSPAMLFNGSTGYLSAPNAAALQLAGDLSLEMWINVSLATRQTLISKSYLNEFEFTLETDGRLNLYQGNGTSYEGVLSAAGAVTANSWQHVVVTRTAATKTIRFYVNGIATGSGTYLNPPTSGPKAVVIGRSDNYPGVRYVNGRIDEVALYPAALSPAQIAAHYLGRSSTGTGPIALQLVASDADGDGLTYDATGLPSGLTLNAATGLISGTLSATSAGIYQVTATASDGSLSSTQTFTWTVIHVDRAPTLSGPGNQASAENASISLQLAAIDPDGDTLTYSASGLPASLTVNPATGLIAGTLSFTGAGTYAVTTTVTDGSLSSRQTFTWTVANTNRAPVFANPGAQTTWDVSGYPQAALSDAPVAYWRLGESSATTVADSAGINAGTVFGGVTVGQAGALADGDTAMVFNGSSGYIRVASAVALPLAGDLTIELWTNVSLATRQTLISKDYLHELELTVETSGYLSFYQGNGATSEGVASVAGAITANTWQHVVVTRTAATKTIRFYVNGIAAGSGTYLNTPTSGPKAIVIGRSDNYPGVRYVNGRLDEVALYSAVLSPAQIAAHYALRTSASSPTVVALQLSANDADGDALTYSAIGLPFGLTVNAATGLVSGTLSPASAGIHQVTAAASDGNLSNTQTFTWTVTRVNRAPVLTNPGNQASAENTGISLQLAASDPEGDGLTYSATGLPASLTINATTGLISGTLAFTSAGTYVVTATTSDGSLSSSLTFTWTVANTDRAPILTNPGNQTNGDISGYAPAVLSDAPVAYWRLGDNTGTSAADSAGANPGTLFGGVVLGQSGALGDGNPAMLFNGSTGYVRGASPATILAGDLTIEMWINVSLAARQTLISKGYLYEFELTLETSGHISFYQGNGTTSEGVASVSGAVSANAWQHVVVTRTAATKTIRFYVNGIAKGSGTYANTPASSAREVVIGRSDNYPGVRYVNGRLDEVSLYPSALSAAQVAAHHAQRASAVTPTVVALQLAANDPDGDGLTYTAIGLPLPLTVNAATGLISGTLSPASAGTYQVTATASDGSLSNSQTFTWTITHVSGGS